MSIDTKLRTTDRRTSFISFGVVVLLFSVASFHDAWAYLDPGTGSYVLQMVTAAALGALLTVKLWWAKFVGLFKKDSQEDKTTKKTND